MPADGGVVILFSLAEFFGPRFDDALSVCFVMEMLERPGFAFGRRFASGLVKEVPNIVTLRGLAGLLVLVACFFATRKTNALETRRSTRASNPSV
jgi:hypothetical protein